ncbi:MAG: aldehyde dehydrogenase family protein, partial [Sediminibacterium sp.]
MKIINPATEELVQEIVSSTEQSLDQSFEELSIGQHNWKLTSLASRVQILAKFSDLLAEEAAQLAYDLSSEMGKPLAQAKNEINGARGRITWMLNN